MNKLYLLIHSTLLVSCGTVYLLGIACRSSVVMTAVVLGAIVGTIGFVRALRDIIRS